MLNKIEHVTQEVFDGSTHTVLGEAAANYMCVEVFGKEKYKALERKMASSHHHYLMKPCSSTSAMIEQLVNIT